jgi:hypothetical protein
MAELPSPALSALSAERPAAASTVGTAPSAPADAPSATNGVTVASKRLASSGPANSPRSPAPSTPASQEGESNPYVAAPELPKPAFATATCVLNLNAMPAALVVLDGKPLGYTPKIGVSVAPGDHRVFFRWHDGEKHETFACDRGESKTIAVRQRDPSSTDEPFIKNPYR